MCANPLKPTSAARRLGRWLNRGLRNVGAKLEQCYPPGHHMRPIGRLRDFLEDIRTRGFQCENVLDVGASDASWSREFLRVYPDAGGLLVEPRPECEHALKDFCVQNPRWSYVRTALGETDGTRPLALWETASTLLPDNVAKAEHSITVGVRRCDSLLSSLSSTTTYPDVMKLDVEGYELEVLDGAQATLRHVQLLVAEAALYPFGTRRPLVHDMVAFLADLDFFLYDFAGYIRRPHDGAVALVDLAFVPRGSTLRGDVDAW